MEQRELDANIPVLNSMLSCNVGCAGDFKPKTFAYEEDTIDWLYRNLPSVPYVIKQMINYIFSNGLTTGDEKQDEILNEFLYAYNIKGATNYSVIQEAVKESIIYGKCGLRFLSKEDGLINVNSMHYNAITADNEEYYGFKDTIGYLVSFDKEKIYETDLKEVSFDREAYKKNGVIVDKSKKLMVLSKDYFVSLRNTPTQEKADSPLAYDKQRIDLLKRIYERLNYDIEYDGPGRILFWLKDGYENGGENETGTTELVNQSFAAKADRANQARREVTEMGKKIKDSKSDSIIAVPGIFNDKVLHLPKTTQATDLKEYIEKEGDIIAQVFGINPTLIGLGEVSGNVSMEKIIDNAMLNSIIPEREKYAIQFSEMLSTHLGLDKVYFDKYEMKQVVDENAQRVKIAEIISKLALAGQNTLADKFAKMLDEDIDDGKGGVKKLKTKAVSFIKKIFGGKKNENRQDE